MWKSQGSRLWSFNGSTWSISHERHFQFHCRYHVLAKRYLPNPYDKRRNSRAENHTSNFEFWGYGKCCTQKNRGQRINVQISVECKNATYFDAEKNLNVSFTFKRMILWHKNKYIFEQSKRIAMLGIFIFKFEFLSRLFSFFKSSFSFWRSVICLFKIETSECRIFPYFQTFPCWLFSVLTLLSKKLRESIEYKK